VFNWVQIRAINRPIQNPNSPGLKPFLYLFGDINRGVILLKKGARHIVTAQIFLQTYYIGPGYIFLAFGVRIFVYNLQKKPPPFLNTAIYYNINGRLYVGSNVNLVFGIFFL